MKFLVIFLLCLVSISDSSSFDVKRLKASYDFVIVGAGSAGCVLANRLSENPEWSVLLIEAGGEEKVLFDVPAFVTFLQGTGIDWQYKAEPSEQFCLGMVGGQCKLPRGKVLGGSSVLNHMIYTRGFPKDYDNWAQNGSLGWSYKDVLPYFKKLENAQLRYSTFDPDYRGKGGPVTVTDDLMNTTISDAFINAGIEIGLSKLTTMENTILEFLNYKQIRKMV